MIRTPPIEVEILGRDTLSKDLTRIEGNVQAFATKLTKLGSSLTKYFSVPMAALGGASVKFAIDINRGMSEVATLIPGNTRRVNDLKSSIQDLSAATGTSTDALVGGLYETISQFEDTSETIDRLTIANTAAIAGMTDTRDAVNLLAAVTKGYGDTTAEAVQKASDLAFLAIKHGKTTFPELAASIGKVTSTSDLLNVSQEELFGTIATLTGVTGDTSEVMTQIASIYSAILKPTSDLTNAVNDLGLGYKSAFEMIKGVGLRETLIKIGEAAGGPKKIEAAVKKLGFTSLDAAIKTLGYTEVNERLGEALTKNGDALAKMFGRKEGLVATLSLLGGQSENFAKKIGYMNERVGATKAAFDEVDSGINKTGRDFDKIKAKAVVFAQRVGERLLPILERLFNKIEPWLKKIEKLDAASLEFGLKLAGIAIAAGPVITAIGKLGLGFLGLIRYSRGLSGLSRISSGLSGIGSSALGAAVNVGKLRGALGLLGKAGLVGDAALAGVAAGTALHELVVKPREEKKFKQEETIRSRHARIARKFAKGGYTTEEKSKMISQLDEDLYNLSDSMTSFGGDLSYITGLFTGEKNVNERYLEEWNKMKETRDKINESFLKDLREIKKINKETERLYGPSSRVSPGGKASEKTVNINFSADVPGSVRVNAGRGLTTANTGRIMSGL